MRRSLRRLEQGRVPKLVCTRRCHRPEDLHLVRRTFAYRGKGRETTVVVRLQRRAMIHLMRAMLDAPSIQVTTSLFGSYRSCELQRELYERYKAGGPLAAPPGKSGHNLGAAVDLYRATPSERRVMRRHGWSDLLPADPPHQNLCGAF